MEIVKKIKGLAIQGMGAEEIAAALGFSVDWVRAIQGTDAYRMVGAE